MLPPHPLFPHPSKCLFLSLVKLLFSRLSPNVQMIGFVSKEKRESCLTSWSTAKHLTPARERKQRRLIFAKSILLSSSEACSLCVPLTLSPAAVLPLNYSWETTYLSIFSLSVANGLSIPLCPTVKPINLIKLLKVIFSRSRKAVADWQHWLSIGVSIVKRVHWVNQGKFAWMAPEVILYLDHSIMFLSASSPCYFCSITQRVCAHVCVI